MSVPWITILSVPRSGTNHTCRLLSRLDGIRVYYEWFDRRVAYADPETLTAFEGAVGRKFEGFEDPELSEWVHAHVPETLALLQAAAEPPPLATVVKVFRSHLPEDDLTRYFFANPNMSFVVIRRRPVDCYVSFLKAMALEKYLRVDTTDVRPTISASDFRDWHQATSLWFDDTIQALERHRRNYVVLDYDRDILGVDEMKLLRRLREILKDFGVETRIPVRTFGYWLASQTLGRVISLRNFEGGTLGLPQQDRSPQIEDKIGNWPEFARDLEAMDGDLRRLSGYFLEEAPAVPRSAWL